MLLNHLWGLYAHPTTEWQNIQRSQTGLAGSLIYLAVLALRSAIFIAAVS